MPERNDDHYGSPLARLGRQHRARHRVEGGQDYIVPKLRALPDAEGRLKFLKRSDLPPGQVSEDWWDALADDPRLRVRDDRHRLDALGSQSSDVLSLACRACAWRRDYGRADMLAMFGAGKTMSDLRFELANCPRGRPLVCKAYWVPK